MPIFRFEEDDCGVHREDDLVPGLYKHPSFDVVAETQGEALLNFAKRFKLEPGTLAMGYVSDKSVVHGQDADGKMTCEFCQDCNDYHYAWTLKRING